MKKPKSTLLIVLTQVALFLPICVLILVERIERRFSPKYRLARMTTEQKMNEARRLLRDINAELVSELCNTSPEQRTAEWQDKMQTSIDWEGLELVSNTMNWLQCKSQGLTFPDAFAGPSPGANRHGPSQYRLAINLVPRECSFPSCTTPASQ